VQGVTARFDWYFDRVVLHRPIVIGVQPDAVAVDSTTHTVYVTSGETCCAAPGVLSVIDGQTNTVTSKIDNVGNEPESVAVDPITHTAYAGDFQSLYVVTRLPGNMQSSPAAKT